MFISLRIFLCEFEMFGCFDDVVFVCFHVMFVFMLYLCFCRETLNRLNVDKCSSALLYIMVQNIDE